MPAFFIYLVKTIVCSAIFYAYYRVAFYNRVNHQWNRFYLLASVLMSLLLPAIRIYVPVGTFDNPAGVVRILNVVAASYDEAEGSAGHSAQSISWQMLPVPIYMAVSAALLFIILKSLLRIIKLHRKNPGTMFCQFNVVMTTEKDAPFSFMKTIFWNTKIDIHSQVGRRIFIHEAEHVRQLHSIDRLLLNAVNIIFWCNPFFWLIRRELIVVHEFLADRKAIHDNNTHAFSEMLLSAAFPGKRFAVTSPFFSSSIKRRLSMLTKFNHLKASLFAKWLLVPTLFVLLAGFSLSKRQVSATGPAAPFTVVIDAGHGGERNGISAPDGTKEKDLNLAIAKKVKSVNSNPNIKIVMTRESDEDIPLRTRVENARSAGADAFISIHINNAPAETSGIQLLMTRNVNEYASKSQLLGSLLSQELSKVYKVDGELQKGSDKGVWVLDAPEINYPSLLIELGNLNNSNDLNFIKSEQNQERIAKQILAAVTQFAGGN